MTSSNPSGARERLVDMVEEVRDVGVGRRRMIEAVVPVGVGRANEPAVPPGKDEEHALFRAQDEGAFGVDTVPRHDQVHSLGGPHDHGVGDTGKPLDLGCPHPGGIDHRSGTHVELTAGLEVLSVDTGDPVALVQEGDDAERRTQTAPYAAAVRASTSEKRASSTWASK